MSTVEKRLAKLEQQQTGQETYVILLGDEPVPEGVEVIDIGGDGNRPATKDPKNDRT